MKNHSLLLGQRHVNAATELLGQRLRKPQTESGACKFSGGFGAVIAFK